MGLPRLSVSGEDRMELEGRARPGDPFGVSAGYPFPRFLFMRLSTYCHRDVRCLGQGDLGLEGRGARSLRLIVLGHW